FNLIPRPCNDDELAWETYRKGAGCRAVDVSHAVLHRDRAIQALIDGCVHDRVRHDVSPSITFRTMRVRKRRRIWQRKILRLIQIRLATPSLAKISPAGL